MPTASTRSAKNKKSPSLPDSIEQRLTLLTRTLGEAEIAAKSIDIVKEIKELQCILRSLREEGTPGSPQPGNAQPIMVVWGGPQNLPQAVQEFLPQSGAQSGAQSGTQSMPQSGGSTCGASSGPGPRAAFAARSPSSASATPARAGRKPRPKPQPKPQPE